MLRMRGLYWMVIEQVTPGLKGMWAKTNVEHLTLNAELRMSRIARYFHSTFKVER
jgi:hypothetical protein